MKIVIDTDAGVDDAAAIAWLFCQDEVPVDVLGITTVAGNTTVENVTNNVLILLDVLERLDLPLIIGASRPLERPLELGSALIHGSDGFWFLGAQHPHELQSLPTDPSIFYQRIIRAHPGTKLLALGPLTNVARAIQLFPEDMKQFSEIIVLGASKKATVPFDDFNLWLDPEAAAIVLAAGIPTTLVTVEAQEQFVLSQTELNELTKHGNPVAKLIAEPMKYFLETMTGFTGEVGTSFADVVGAMVAVELDIIKNSENALVKIDTGYRLARGQTYIGNNFADKLMLAVTEETLNEWATKAFNGSDFNLEQEVFTALAREPENALVITEVDQVRMKAVFMATLCSYLNI